MMQRWSCGVKLKSKKFGLVAKGGNHFQSDCRLLFINEPEFLLGGLNKNFIFYI